MGWMSLPTKPPKPKPLTKKQQGAWDANVQAVQDAKAAIVAAKHEWTEALKERSRRLAPLLMKQRRGVPLTSEERALVADQDQLVRTLGAEARARRDDLETARQRFKDAEGCT